MRGRYLILAALALACAVVAAPSAFGDGGPSSGAIVGGKGVEAGAERFVAIPAIGWTTIAAIRRDGGHVGRFMTLRGSWGIPVVAGDGTTDGLMSDRRSLVVAQSTAGPYLRKRSSFALVDTKRMLVLRKLRVPGHQVFDALSPDDRYMYLVEYVSPQDFSRYRVRVYDLHAGRLLPKPLVDPRERTTTMHGYPVSRATSADRRWVYTLYAAAHHSFIHALDTRNVRAVCIDMPWHGQPKRLFEFRLRVDGEGRLVVRGPRGRILVAIDRRSHRIVSSVPHP